MAQFMQVTMSNHKSTESAIKNLEIQVGQLVKQMADNSSGSFGANIEKNLKEEYKAIMTWSKKEINVENEGRSSEKQELATEEGEEEKEKEGDQLREKEINEEKEKEEKNEKNKEKEEEKKTKSELGREKKKEAIPCSRKEVPYPLVSSKKDTKP